MIKNYCDICDKECEAGVYRFRYGSVQGMTTGGVAIEYGSRRKQACNIIVRASFHYDDMIAPPTPDWAKGSVPDLCDNCANKLLTELKVGK